MAVFVYMHSENITLSLGNGFLWACHLPAAQWIQASLQCVGVGGHCRRGRVGWQGPRGGSGVGDGTHAPSLVHRESREARTTL